MGRKKGFKLTEEHKKKISNSLKGRHVSPETEWEKGKIPFNKGKGKIKAKDYKDYQRKYQNSYNKGEGRNKYLIRQRDYYLTKKMKENSSCVKCKSKENLEAHHISPQ